MGYTKSKVEEDAWFKFVKNCRQVEKFWVNGFPMYMGSIATKKWLIVFNIN